MNISLTPYIIIRLSTRFLSEAAVGVSHSKKVRALSGLRMALTPNPMNIVAIALAAMRRKDDWEMAMVLENCCGWSAVGRYDEWARLPFWRVVRLCGGGGFGSTFDLKRDRVGGANWIWTRTDASQVSMSHERSTDRAVIVLTCQASPGAFVSTCGCPYCGYDYYHCRDVVVCVWKVTRILTNNLLWPPVPSKDAGEKEA